MSRCVSSFDEPSSAAPLGWSFPAKSVGDAFVSPVWISASCITVGCLLIVLSVVGMFLVAIELTSKKRRNEWKLRPIACGLLTVMCALEAAFFFSFPMQYWRTRGVYYALASFPQVFFTCALLLCSYLFGSIFHDVYFQGVMSDTEIAIRKTRRAKIQLASSAVIAALQLALFGVALAVPPSQYEPIQIYFNAALGVGAGLAFPLYLSYLLHKRWALGRRNARVMYQHRLLQCLTVALLASGCSIARGVLALFWRQLATAFSRQLYWVFTACAFTITDLLPVTFLFILFKVVSFQGTWFVGTADVDYWRHTKERSVEGHDFSLLLPSEGDSRTDDEDRRSD